MAYYKYCPNCKNIQEFESIDYCLKCNCKLIETDIEYNCVDWALRETEVVEKIQSKYKYRVFPIVFKDDGVKEQTECVPTCPTCHSTDVIKITTGKKAAGFALLGVFNSNFRKMFMCNNCGYKW